MDRARIDGLLAEAERRIAKAASAEELEQCRVSLLGRSGELTLLLREVGKLPAAERKEAGAALNRAKNELEERIRDRTATVKGGGAEGGGMDVTFPGRVSPRGFAHPISMAFREILDILRGLGFERVDGPEVETDYNNFEALNTPPDHPARDMQDTYYLPGGMLLRTQTSSVWVHVMSKRPPPLRIVSPGRVYRRDEADASHTPVFHQVEGLWVDDKCRFSDLKGMLEAFLTSYFGSGTKVRFDPSYFPFTEPSAEVSISCAACGGKGCATCKHTGWVELLGAGMVHPAILARSGGEYAREGMRGFAFGVGVERMLIMKFGIPDLRWLYDNDLRILSQFRG